MIWNDLDVGARADVERFVAALEEQGWDAASWHKLLLSGAPCSPQGHAELTHAGLHQSMSFELGSQSLVWTVMSRYVAYHLRIRMPSSALAQWSALLAGAELVSVVQIAELGLELAARVSDVAYSLDGQAWTPLLAQTALADFMLQGEPLAKERLSQEVIAALEQASEGQGWAAQAQQIEVMEARLEALRQEQPTLSWAQLSAHFEALGLNRARIWATLWPVFNASLFYRSPLFLTLELDSPAKLYAQALGGELAPDDGARPLEDLYDQALELLALGALEQACGLLARVLAARPAFAEAWHNLAIVYGRCDQPMGAQMALSLATACYQAHIEHDPQDAYAWFWLASAQLAAGDIGQAIESLEQAIELEPGYAQEAMLEPDFEPLRDHPRFLKLVD